MHYMKSDGVQITFYYSNTHTKMQMDGVQYRAPYLFDAAVNFPWLP